MNVYRSPQSVFEIDKGILYVYAESKHWLVDLKDVNNPECIEINPKKIGKLNISTNCIKVLEAAMQHYGDEQ